MNTNFKKNYLDNLITKSYKDKQGFHVSYDYKLNKKIGYINTNDFGDFVPYLDYYGYDSIIENWLEDILIKYDVLYYENVLRFGSTKLSKYGVIDLYSNSDLYHGLLYILQDNKYIKYHSRIRLMFDKLISLLNTTKYTNFYKINKKYISLPLYRLLDIGMYPELLIEYGENHLAEKLLRLPINKILSTNKPLSKTYLFNFPIQKESYLMKDHTNLLFSYIRFYRANKNKFSESELKSLIDIIIKSFSKGDVLFNATNEKDYADTLVFAILEVILEAYLLTYDNYYFEYLKKNVPFWLEVISKKRILPIKINPITMETSNSAIVDSNTDFYIFLRKLILFTGTQIVSKEFVLDFKKDIFKIFVDDKTYDIYTSVNMNNFSKDGIVKSKFTALFHKIFIFDDIKEQSDYFNREVYLDDR